MKKKLRGSKGCFESARREYSSKYCTFVPWFCRYSFFLRCEILHFMTQYIIILLFLPLLYYFIMIVKKKKNYYNRLPIIIYHYIVRSTRSTFSISIKHDAVYRCHSRRRCTRVEQQQLARTTDGQMNRRKKVYT